MSLELSRQKNNIELQEQQVKQLRASLEESFSSKIIFQITDLCKEKAKLEVKEIHKIIEPKIFTSCDDFLNELLYEDEIESASLREYIKNFNPSVLLKALSEVTNVKSTWFEYNNFHDKVTNHTLFAEILKRHKANPAAFISFQEKLVVNGDELVGAFDDHYKKIRDHVELLQAFAERAEGNRTFKAGAGVVGSIVAGPVGGIVSRVIASGLTDSSSYIKVSWEEVDMSWKKINSIFSRMLKDLENRYEQIYFLLLGGYFYCVQKDLNQLGYQIKQFSTKTMQVNISILFKEQKQVEEWLNDYLKNIEDSIRNSQFQEGQKLLSKLLLYIEGNKVIARHEVNNASVKEHVLKWHYIFTIAAIEKELWLKGSELESVRQYLKLFRNLQYQPRVTESFYEEIIPSIENIFSRIIHVSVMAGEDLNDEILQTFRSYCSLNKNSSSIAQQLVRIFELYTRFSTDIEKLNLNINEINYTQVLDSYNEIFKDKKLKKDSFSSFLKRRQLFSTLKMSKIIIAYDQVREVSFKRNP